MFDFTKMVDINTHYQSWWCSENWENYSQYAKLTAELISVETYDNGKKMVVRVKNPKHNALDKRETIEISTRKFGDLHFDIMKSCVGEEISVYVTRRFSDKTYWMALQNAEA